MEFDTVTAEVPDTLDLAERCELALRGVANTSDPDDDFLFWFEIYWNANPPFLKHSGCDIECGFKILDNFFQLRHASGCEDYREREEGLLKFLLSCVEEDGLFYSRLSPKRPWHMGAYSELRSEYESKQVDLAGPNTTGGLMAALATRNASPEEQGRWDDVLRSMARGLEAVAIKREDYAYYPDCKVGHPFWMPRGGWPATEEPGDEHATGEGSVVAYFGYPLQGLTRWAVQSGDERALDFAGQIARFGMKRKFWGHPGDPDRVAGNEQGHVDSHFHARAIFLRGLLEYGLAVGNRDAVDFVRSSYEHMRAWGINRIGFIPTWVDGPRLTMETCFLGDLVALGVRMSDAGVADLWEDVDRIARNHLVEAQITDIEILKRIQSHVYGGDTEPSEEGDGAPATSKASQVFLSPEDMDRTDNQICTDNVLERTLGVFAAYLLPTCAPNARTMSCCNANGCRGLYYAWEAITRRSGDDGQVNLLLNRAAPWLDVESHLPYDGKAVIRNKACRRVSVRIPAWVRLADVLFRVNGENRGGRFVGRYAVADNLQPGDTIELSFPVAEEIFRRTAHARTEDETMHTIHVRGNTVVDISPRDENPAYYPFYRREHMKEPGPSPTKAITRNVATHVPRW